MIKAAFACDLTRLTGVKHEFEYRFAAPDRQWRADIAFPSVKVAIEIDGGLWTYGRHNRAASMLGDMEKGNGYAARGWIVFHTPWEWIYGGRRDKSAELRAQIAAAIVANKKGVESDEREN